MFDAQKPVDAKMPFVHRLFISTDFLTHTQDQTSGKGQGVLVKSKVDRIMAHSCIWEDIYI